MQYIISEEMLETFENTLLALRCYANRDGKKELSQLISNVLEELEKIEKI